MTGWEVVNDQDHAEKNTPYRTWFWLPYFVWPLRGAIAGALRAAQSLGRKFHPIIQVTGHEIFSAEDSPHHQLVPANELPRGAFVIRVTWEKHGEGTPVVVLVAIIALIIVAVGGWVVMAKVTERQFTQVLDDLRDTLHGFFSPGFVVAAMVVLVVIFTRGGKS